ncbi:MAG: dihydroxyacetone kinase subunit DhaL [Capnocytophaga sp.]|nr:dihydroxyacetone kinase subunit DhaL [Capnocytophaga sp.]
MSVSKAQICHWLDRIYLNIEENKDHLTQLDEHTGDADHGINLSRGFQKVKEKVDTLPTNADIGLVFKTVAMALISNVGGASGSLYGSFFLKGFFPANQKQELTDEEFVKVFAFGVSGIKERGKAELGDKTMIDLWVPVLETMQNELRNGKTIQQMADDMLRTATLAREKSKFLVSKKGRASLMGTHTVGMIDPGVESSYLIIKSLHSIL